MIGAYVKCGYIGYALKLFDHMSHRDLVSWCYIGYALKNEVLKFLGVTFF